MAITIYYDYHCHYKLCNSQWNGHRQPAGLAASLHHLSVSKGPFGKLEAGKWLIGLRRNNSIINIIAMMMMMMIN